MTSPATLIQRASKLLYDPDYKCWDQACLLDFYNEAITVLSSLRPAAVSTCVELTLGSGSKQELPDNISHLVAIESNADEAGSEAEGSQVTMSASDMVKALRGKRACVSDDICDYAVGSFRHHNASQNIFFVEPAVPLGETPVVTAIVVENHEPIKLCDIGEDCPIDARFDAALLDWMLYRAYSMEAESQSSYAAARRHQAAFYDMVNGTYLAETRLRSGYILGQEGTGVERTGWRNESREFGR